MGNNAVLPQNAGDSENPLDFDGLAELVDKFDVIENTRKTPGNRVFRSKIENSYSFCVTLA